MQDPKEIIKSYLKNFLERESISSEFDISIQDNSKFGDFSSNIAMVSFKATKGHKSPLELSEKIIKFLNESEEVKENFAKIEVAGAGFINFYLSDKYLFKNLTNVLESKNYGSSSVLKNTRTIVEFGDPNPFKEIHIGHLRNFCIGESFSRLLEASGADVIRVNYQGDVGMHVAKALYGIKKKDLSMKDLTARDLAEAYAFGAGEFENSATAKEEIQRLNKLVYLEDNEIKELWEKGRQISLEGFEALYKRIGVTYDNYYFESQAAKRGRQIVLDHIEDGIFERDAGAVIYRGENDGFHTRVFLTSEDYATYEAKDLALAIMKDEDLHYDKSIILTGNEQAQYFQVMLAALKKISPELSARTTHLTFGHVKLKDGKMSSRTGDVVTAKWLIDEAIGHVKKTFPELDDAIAEKVGMGAVKYSMLKFAIPSDIHFDFSESISLEGNSGPYLQYTYVRTQSVLAKATKNGKWQMTNDKPEKEESDILRFLAQYPYHVEGAAKDFAPNVICSYLFELSQKFNLFYEKHKILDSENEEFRLSLTSAVGQVLQNGLNLLGVETVERM